MKRIKHHYDRENNKCKKKMHFTFHFVKIFISQAQRPAQFPSQVFLADWRKLR